MASSDGTFRALIGSGIREGPVARDGVDDPASGGFLVNVRLSAASGDSCSARHLSVAISRSSEASRALSGRNQNQCRFTSTDRCTYSVAENSCNRSARTRDPFVRPLAFHLSSSHRTETLGSTSFVAYRRVLLLVDEIQMCSENSRSFSIALVMAIPPYTDKGRRYRTMLCGERHSR